MRNVRSNGKHGTTGILTPTVELNALAMKRGERALYLLETMPPNPYMAQPGNAYGYHRNNMYGPQGQPRYNYDARRNHTNRGGHYMGHYAYNQYKSHNYPHQQPQGNEMFNVILRVGSISRIHGRGSHGSGCQAQRRLQGFARTQAVTVARRGGESVPGRSRYHHHIRKRYARSELRTEVTDLSGA